MQMSELLERYGNQSAIARRFGVTRAYVSKWAKTGLVPEKYRLRELAGEVVQELEAGAQNASTRRPRCRWRTSRPRRSRGSA